MHVKRISILGSVILASLFMWGAAHAWLTSVGRFSDLQTMIVPTIAAAVVAAVVSLAWLLLDRPIERIAGILAAWASFLVFWRPDVWYLSILPIFALAWYAAATRIHTDIHQRFKLDVRAGLDRGMRLILLGVFIMISLGFFLLPASRSATVASVSSGISQSIALSTKSQLVQSQLQQLPKSMQVEVQRELTSQIDAQVRAWLGPVAPFLPPALAFALFLGLWSVSVLFRGLGLALAMGIFWVLRRTGFVKVEEKDVKAEIVTLS